MFGIKICCNRGGAGVVVAEIACHMGCGSSPVNTKFAI